jgi:hypothetical protein
MAEVFKAKAFGVEGFEKLIAIKRILPSMAEDADFIQMFIDEAKICGQLNHANICQTYELGRIEDSHFIAMEYIWGKDLLQIQNRFRRLRRSMPPMMAAFIGAKVCEGLDYAHRKKDATGRPLGIIHRDVSPQNILVSYDGEIKVIDFGIAKAASRSSKTQAGVLKGKFGYMSPEHVRGLELDRRSDIFSIGTILYEILTGERLFLGESDFATLEKIRSADVPPPSKMNPEIPPVLDQIILKALAREADERYQWASEMQEALQNFLLIDDALFNAKSLSGWMREQFAVEMRREAELLEQQRRIGREYLTQAGTGRAAPPANKLRPASAVGVSGTGPGARPAPAAAAGAIEIDTEGDGDVGSEKTAISQAMPVPSEAEAGALPNQATQIVATDDLVVDVGEELPNQATQIVGMGGPADAHGPGAEELPNQATQIVGMGGPADAHAGQGQGQGQPDLPALQTVVFQQDPSQIARQAPAQAQTPAQMPMQAPSPYLSAAHSAAYGPGALPGQGHGTGMMAAPMGTSGHPMVMAPPNAATMMAGPGQPMVMQPPVTADLSAAYLAQAHRTGYTQLPQESAYTSGYSKSNLIWKDILVGVAVAAVVVVVVLGARFLMSPAKGTIILTVLPPRTADVIFDGKTVGRLQPGGSLLIRDVTLATHQLRVRSDDGEAEQALAVASAEPVQVTMQLSPRQAGPQGSGLIRLKLPPDGALVSIDGRLVSDADIQKGYLVSAGAHQIHVTKAGKRDQHFAVTVPAGGEVEKKIELVDARGKLTVNTDPPGAEVTLNGVNKGKSPLVLEDVETDRPLRVSARKRGAGQASKTVMLGDKGGYEQVLTLKLREEGKGEEGKGEGASPGAPVAPVAEAPQSGESGYLVANTKPWAKVFIDGKDTGRTTPIAPRDRIPLRPGKHTVTFVANQKKHSFEIVVKPGEEKKIIQDLGDTN